MCEIRDLSRSRFAESITEATLEADGTSCRLEIPWEQGTWNFAGRNKPVAGTLVIVEETENGRVIVGTTTLFYDVSLIESKR